MAMILPMNQSTYLPYLGTNVLKMHIYELVGRLGYWEYRQATLPNIPQRPLPLTTSAEAAGNKLYREEAAQIVRSGLNAAIAYVDDKIQAIVNNPISDVYIVRQARL